jgi:eukaryotic-like serine/threonine-protein kinase
MGTPEYMSPEQAQGTHDLTPASDLYCIGVVLYELLTGRVPFRRATPLATAHAHLHERVPSPSKLNPAIPAELERIVLQCLAKRPDQRFRSARELFEALAAYERGAT